ncbi:hypothetical protein M426DRAFT_127590 [Hypoxylon sp. CI-4A]|nr:hypothetical protein M426DRAFT_127590 [Hypoxylon sp. CI-4A]
MFSAVLQPSGRPIRVPEVSQAEIDSFHDAHFSSAAVGLFDVQFFRPENAQNDDEYYDAYDEYYEEEEEEEDDGLGYYPDGVKRTLTDEQIEIFRHSEIEALRRVEAKTSRLREESAALLQAAKDRDASEQATTPPTVTQDGMPGDNEVEGEVADGSEDGEIEAEAPQLTKAEEKRLKRQRARRKKQEQRKFNPEKKPDLRKRTWDVVEAGMDSLDYDELEGAQGSAAAPPAQRRRISYDD